ncbi:MAG: ABC transporter transmembrane domain-containing protein, partial [Xanthobacteraceae bacterium]
MSDFQRPARVLKRQAGAGDPGLLSTLVHLWPYIWPSDRRDLKGRVIVATLLILAAKLATIAVPFTFKWATDALAGHGTAPLGPDDVIAWALATPIMMTIAYGGMRVVMAILGQSRDAIFAKVAMNAVRRLAMCTFEHMHVLSLRFHLERRTGGLTRILQRGRDAIETIVRMLLLQLAPTVVEVALVAWVLLFHFDWRYLVVIMATVALYIAFT